MSDSMPVRLLTDDFIARLREHGILKANEQLLGVLIDDESNTAVRIYVECVSDHRVFAVTPPKGLELAVQRTA